MVRIQITAGGIYDANGEEIAVGTELDLQAEPTAWVGRYTVLSDDDGKKPVKGKGEPGPAKE